MGKRFFSLVNLALAIALILSGCMPAAQSQVERKPIKVEYTTWLSDYTLLIAQEKGFFANNGLQVEPVFYEVFSKVLPDMAGKKVDVGLLAVGDLIANASYVDLKAVAVADSGGVLRVVSRPEIKTIAELKGKTVGVPIDTYGELVVRRMLQSANMTVKDVTLINMDPEMVTDGLGSKKIDAGFVWEPWDRKALEAGNHSLYDVTPETPLFPDLIVFRQEVIDQRPEDVRMFVKAWFAALEYRKAHPDECNAIIARLTNQKIEDLTAETSVKLFTLRDNEQLFDKSNVTSATVYSAAKVNLEYMISTGSITFAPDLEKIIDPSYLK
jgi:NitT/TauT family transport system substrate-binding protein